MLPEGYAGCRRISGINRKLSYKPFRIVDDYGKRDQFREIKT
jgi:hypothetical protein